MTTFKYLFVTVFKITFVVTSSCYHETQALQETTVPPLLDVPTYSLATLNKDGTTNMNIMTYVTPSSIRPDRVWSLGLYRTTLTEENLLRRPVCVLQLLSSSQANLVRVLGGTSGRDVDKKGECAKLGFEWTDLEGDEDGIQVIKGCTNYLKLRIHGGLIDAGSHLVVPFCQVQRMYDNNDDDDDNKNDDDRNSRKHLSTSMLRDLGIINAQGRVVVEEDDHP